MARGENNSGLILGIVVVGGYFLYKDYIHPNVIAPKKLVTYAKKLRVNIPGMKLKGDMVYLDLFIQNPNPDPVTINAIVGDAWITYQGNALKMGNIASYPNIVIQSLGETKYTFPIRLKFAPLVAYFNDLLAGKATGQAATFKGTVTVDKRAWPVQETLKIS